MQAVCNRSPLARRRARRSTIVVAAIAAVLLPAGAAFAAKPKPEVRVGAHHWAIKVGGHSYTVKAGGKIVYPTCDTVETITPIVKLGAKRGEHAYEAWLVGPKSAGESQAREEVFSGTSHVFEYRIIALAFPKLTRTVNRTHFVAGTYTLQMQFGGKRAKPTTVETVRLAPKPGCRG
jgi:hypothetical protein